MERAEGHYPVPADGSGASHRDRVGHRPGLTQHTGPGHRRLRRRLSGGGAPVPAQTEHDPFIDDVAHCLDHPPDVLVSQHAEYRDRAPGSRASAQKGGEDGGAVRVVCQVDDPLRIPIQDLKPRRKHGCREPAGHPVRGLKQRRIETVEGLERAAGVIEQRARKPLRRETR